VSKKNKLHSALHHQASVNHVQLANHSYSSQESPHSKSNLEWCRTNYYTQKGITLMHSPFSPSLFPFCHSFQFTHTHELGWH